MQTFRPGDVISSEAVNANFIEARDGTPITCVPASGWSLNFAGQKQGKVVTINVSATRSGSTVNASPGAAQVIGTLSESLTPKGGMHEVGVIPSTGGYFFVLRVYDRQLTIKAFGQASYPQNTRWIGSASWITN